MANEADILSDKTDAQADREPRGVAPVLRDIQKRPKRKRGFYRALKRGENWAVYRQTMNRLMDLVTQERVRILEMQEAFMRGAYYDHPTKIKFSFGTTESTSETRSQE